MREVACSRVPEPSFLPLPRNTLGKVLKSQARRGAGLTGPQKLYISRGQGGRRPGAKPARRLESFPMPRVRQVKKAGGDEGKVAAAQPTDLAALRESEERFRLTFELAGSGLAHIRGQRFMRVNRRLCEILGYPEEELLKLQGKDISHPEDAELLNEQRPRLYAGEIDAVRLEKRYVRKDGSIVWVTFTMVAARDADGKPKYDIAIYDDITARKAAETALREGEARFRRTFELAGAGLAHVSLDGRFLRVNPRLCEVLGYTEQEMIRFTVKDISHPEDRDLADGPRGRVVRGEADSARLEKRYLRKDGSVVWMSLAIALERDAAGRPLYAISVLEDVTARKEAETALRESEARFRSIVDSANEGILVYDGDLKVIDVNAAAERIIGLPRSAMIGEPGFTSLLPCVRVDGAPLPPGERPTRRTVNGGRPLSGEIIGIKRAGGAVTWLSVNTGFLRRPGEEKFYGIVSTIGDITARRHAEEALRESEELFRKTFELAASGIAHVSLDGRFMRANRRLSEMLGYAEGELIGRSVKEISFPDDRDVTDAERALIRAGERESVRFEKRYLRKDGSAVWVSLGVALVRSGLGTPQYEIAMFDDITERKQAEQALREAHEELKRSNSELEQFAYVASHDLQEPLRMVSSYTQLLVRRYNDKFDADAKEFMAYVVDGATRMKQLIEDLLAYSRVGTKGKDFKPVAVEKSLRRAITNLKAAIEESGAAVTNDPLPIVPADEVQLAQLFQNLMGNALKFRSPSVPRIHVGVKDLEDKYEFSVADNGIGIEPQYFERIFMVFQRLHNKGEYPGTGIGLAIVKKVVERHGGQIRVESKLGEGSAFIFTLPKPLREAANGG
jgi:PAS domain S-box-containing protein